jgi:hypothetical protein
MEFLDTANFYYGIGVDDVRPITNPAIFFHGSLVPKLNATYNLGDRYSGYAGPGIPQMWANAYIDDTVRMGRFLMPTGAVAGYVLKSNSVGLGTWQLDVPDTSVFATLFDVDSMITANEFKFSATGYAVLTDSARLVAGTNVSSITQSGHAITVNVTDSVGKSNTSNFSTATFAIVSKRITLSATDSLFEVRAPFDLTVDSIGSIQTSITAVTWNAYNGASAMLSPNASATSSFAIAAGTQNNTVPKGTIISTSVKSITGSGNLWIQFYVRRTAQ